MHHLRKTTSIFSALLAAVMLSSCVINENVYAADGAFPDNSDISIIKQAVLGIGSIEDGKKAELDINEDGKLNIFDAIRIKNEILYAEKRKPVYTANNLDVPMIMQNPELPTGCEATSLTMLLNYSGFSVSKSTIAELMPKYGIYYRNGTMYGPDYYTTFPGNPFNSSGYGCYTPCMVTTAGSYFSSIGRNDVRLKEITGTDFYDLYDYIDIGKPVMIWATMYMIAPRDTDTWTTPEGNRLTWHGNEHCLVLTGYDKNQGIVYINDPLVGKTTYNAETVRTRFEQMGKFCGIIEADGEEPVVHTPQNDSPSGIETGKVYHVGDVIEYHGPAYYSSFGGKSVEADGTFTITEIVSDPSRPYRIRIGSVGWIEYK